MIKSNFKMRAIFFAALAFSALISMDSCVTENAQEFEGVVSRIPKQSRKKTKILFDDGKFFYFSESSSPQIVCVEVGDTLKYTNKHGSRYAKCVALYPVLETAKIKNDSSVPRQYKQSKSQTGFPNTGIIGRIEFGCFENNGLEASVIFTNGDVQIFKLFRNPQMACAEVGDTVVYELKKRRICGIIEVGPARVFCLSIRPDFTAKRDSSKVFSRLKKSGIDPYDPEIHALFRLNDPVSVDFLYH